MYNEIVAYNHQKTVEIWGRRNEEEGLENLSHTGHIKRKKSSEKQ